jgi:hypothetical protein
MDPTHRGRVVATRLEAFQQIPEIALKLHRIRLCRFAIHASRAILAYPTIGFVEKLLVNVMSERRKHRLG